MKKYKIKLSVKLALFGTVIFIAVFSIIGYIVVSLKNLDYFKIKGIVLNRPEVTLDPSYLLGRNIFNVDLNKESRYITGQYPVYKNIRLFRVFPDRLFIVFTERTPVAYVKLYRYFYVDSERVLLYPDKGGEDLDLPVIRGLERKIGAPEPGRQYNIEELITALAIITQIGTNSYLKEYDIERIDVADPVNISCFIRVAGPAAGRTAAVAPALEVKMGRGGMNDKIHILAGLFAQLNEDMGNIKYIDLRFKEPVVKLNDAK